MFTFKIKSSFNFRCLYVIFKKLFLFHSGKHKIPLNIWLFITANMKKYKLHVTFWTMGTVSFLSYASLTSAPLSKFPPSTLSSNNSECKLSLGFDNFIVDKIFHVFPFSSSEGWRLFANTHQAQAGFIINWHLSKIVFSSELRLVWLIIKKCKSWFIFFKT